MNKTNIQNWFFYMIAWTIVALTLFFSSIINVHIYLDYFNLYDLINQNEMARYLISNYRFLEGTLFGIFFGSFNFIINWVIDQTRITRISFGKLIILKTFLYTISAIIVFILIFYTIKLFKITTFDPDFWHEAPAFFTTEFIIFITLFYVFSAILINFLVGINRKFGPGNLLNMFTGRYHKPRVENKIFLFIDMKDSTSIAEKLGHITYSQLIQKSFLDVNSLIPKYYAEIYQYVGDEVVVIWNKDIGMRNLNCINFFFAFIEKINANSEVYLKKFSVVPEFKGGINIGEVTTAEVGLLRRDIAYHGDVVNTAARIQNLCKKYNVNLLATKEIIDLIPNTSRYLVELQGEKLLKGKSENIPVYSILPNKGKS